MSIKGPVVLPKDVLILPVSELSARVRRDLTSKPGSFAVTRPRGRSTSKIVDAAAAELLEEFRTPQLAVEAVLAYARRHGLDPRQVLAGAFPMLRDCFNARFLVTAGSPEASAIQPSLPRGELLDGWTVLRSVQVLEDSEVYQVRGLGGEIAALKLLRPSGPRAARVLLDREAMVLQRLGGDLGPRLLGRGAYLGEPYLILSWRSGVTPLLVAAERRERPRRDDALLALGLAIVDAYARLHAAGVVHGDVHPRNMLIDDAGIVTLLDFGLSRFTDGSDRSRSIPRGSIPALRDPAYAAAILAGRTPRRADTASEQYALAALLYLLFTGEDYLDFRLGGRDALTHIVRSPPLPFASRGHRPWPGVETALARALSKSPARRFATVADFAIALRGAAPRPNSVAQTKGSVAPHSPIGGLTDQLLRELRTEAPAYVGEALPAPAASIAFGAAGIGYALYRIACLRDDASLLSLADAWLTRAERARRDPAAFTNEETGLVADEVGRVSPYHCASGLSCVRALVSRAGGNVVATRAAAKAFVDASEAPHEKLDLFTGRCGTLMGAAIVLDALPDRVGQDAAPLRALGAATLDQIWTTIDAQPPIAESAGLPVLGIAHGWAGFAYATLRWCRASGAGLPGSLVTRLDELAALAEPAGRGVRWRVRLDETASAPGVGYQTSWCNGSAGFVHLWTLASRVLGDHAWLELAERSAWNAWESSGAAAHICCGPAGRAYALLALYQATGVVEWVDRARVLADRAALAWSEEVTKPYPLSLYKGATGIAVLGADLDRPESGCMPFFGDEGWPARTSGDSDA